MRLKDARVALAGGTFVMGSEDFYAEEGPKRSVSVAPFEIDVHEVTNRQFAAFVAATGYRTGAERPQAAQSDLAGDARLALLEPGAAVFAPRSGESTWWEWRAGASWRAPEGPGTSIEGLEDYPVVNVTYADALAYADWAGADLPTEEEWEYAARAGLAQAMFEWGNTQMPGGAYRANNWQGPFPLLDQAGDGHAGLAPIGCYPANGYGLHDMTGNVWELTRSAGPDAGTVVIKGGSYLCANDYCTRGRPASRQFQEYDFPALHIGFRTVVRR